MVATVGGPADHVIIHTFKARGAELTSSYEEEKAALLMLSTGQEPTAQLSAYQYALTANPYLKLSRAEHTKPSLFASA